MAWVNLNGEMEENTRVIGLKENSMELVFIGTQKEKKRRGLG
jgi:hypothetical protein